jgi:3-oxoacyl-[acyl-carrier protein] reductase
MWASRLVIRETNDRGLTVEQVIIHYSSNADSAQQVVEKVKSYGVKSVAVKSDATSADFGNVLVEAALKEFDTKTIDIIVNNSGASRS